MKKTFLIIGTVALFAFSSIALTGCGGQNEENKEETHEHNGNEEHEHTDGGKESGDHEENGEHSHAGGGHMDHMNDVRAWLKEELGDKYDNPVPPVTEEQLAMGKKTFMTICATCHGESGKGDGPASAGLEQKPADFTDPSHSAYYSDQGRIYIINNGVEGTPMVGWASTLSEEEIQSVYGYVKSLRITTGANGEDLGEGMYTCSMHPEVSGNKDGKCPKCGMTLIPKEQKHEDDGHNHEH
jgi:mono/diheme cytochrome c family protein